MVWRWSKTAASNATADGTINWAEGQSPSSINDSARAEMARIAQWRDDISGAITSTGTATAYAITTNQVFSSPPPVGTMIAFVPHLTNLDSPTLRLDGGTAYPIASILGVAMTSGILIAGTPYSLMFNGSAWLPRDFYGNPYSVPIGGYLPYSAYSPPNSSFILPYGQAISRAVYSSYFTLISTNYGNGDGSTTFNVPDLRGRTMYGDDAMGGAAAGRLSATYFGAPINVGQGGGAQSKALAQANLPNVTPTGTVATTLSDGNLPGALGLGNISAPLIGVTTGGGTGVTHNWLIADGSGGVVPVASATSTLAMNPLGSATPISTVPPGMIVNFLLRVI